MRVHLFDLGEGVASGIEGSFAFGRDESVRFHFGPFDKPPKKKVWCVQQKDKHNLYGPALVECGSKVEGDVGPEKDPGAKPNEIVPFPGTHGATKCMKS